MNLLVLCAREKSHKLGDPSTYGYIDRQRDVMEQKVPGWELFRRPGSRLTLSNKLIDPRSADLVSWRCPTELSMMRAVFYICTVRDGSH